MKVSGGYNVPKGSIVFCHHRLAALQVSISPSFYKHIFLTNFFAVFLYLQFCFVIFWQKNIGAKADRKLLLKLTTGGFGKRACPGKRLAEVELYIMTAKVFHAFDISLLDDLQVCV